MRRALLAMLPVALLAADDAGLVRRMNRFAAAYRKFVEAHERGLFDVRLARELSRLWREVETSGYWPR